MNNFAKLGLTLLIGLVFAFWPSGASSVEAASPVSVYPTTSYTGEASGHQMVVNVVNLPDSQRQFLVDFSSFTVGYSRTSLISPRNELNNVFVNFPRSQYENIYGLDIYLVGEDKKKINLQITGFMLESFGPSGDSLLVKYPEWTDNQIGMYDLVMITPGKTATLYNALQITEAPVGGSEEEVVVVDEPEVVRPPVTITKTSSTAPAINSYITSPGARLTSTIALEGYGWPDTSYGLEVTLVNTETNERYFAKTLSYVPKEGYLLVHMPMLPDTKNQAYDIVIAPTATGTPRTTIHNAIWIY